MASCCSFAEQEKGRGAGRQQDFGFTRGQRCNTANQCGLTRRCSQRRNCVLRHIGRPWPGMAALVRCIDYVTVSDSGSGVLRGIVWFTKPLRLGLVCWMVCLVSRGRHLRDIHVHRTLQCPHCQRCSVLICLSWRRRALMDPRRGLVV